ncbi:MULTISPECIES: DNA topoisomerase III [Bacillus]|uniref:DNA topoisomerase III n=2 Tax=Bacillaceae TaxID=186817 RepID=UPI00022D8A53|nr:MULTISPECIES: DNA topoisomerase III [Bacillus]EHA28939.1 DNA topoisomerase III [Bacillus subtilis subsp. subtilis str. SC-8]MCL0027488.1 DNA topoisomerase III [Bacillus sp. C21]MCL8470938.1 DNA topoisomerase III [Bacillus subtilis]MEA3600740.1 DNA topoisomerase III [Bacillus subtilis]MED4558527.1 DNA topoisomerase III [Bacillus subtilis]
MSKTVVLAEKPSVGRDLARVLKCHKKGNGYLESDQYIVTWALGHLVTLADPEGYGKEFQSWRLEDLPIIPEPLKLVVIKKTGKQFNAVKSQLTRKDVNQIVIATDAGREGELVARWIIEKANVRKPIKRLWISSVTDKAIKEGFQKLRSGKEYENLYHSAVARAEADWIVGINATRALTTKFNAQLSCGRVQTPTLAMIAKREADIQAFTPVSYYGIRAAVDGMTLTWQDKKSKQTRTFNQDVTSRLLKNLEGKQAVVAELKKTAKKSFAPALYDLTELQRDAHKRFGFSAKETLSVLQKLYEQHKLVTYPRTDSRFLSSDIVPTLKDRLEGMEVKPYAQYVSQIKKRGIKSHKGYVNDAKVSDHHAIIPTEEPLVLSSLSDKERKLYDLIAKRFLAVLMPAFEYEETKVIAEIGGETFTAKGKTVQSQGWKAVYDMADEDDEQEDDRDQTLPALQKGDTLAVRTLTETSGQTKPPARFNEGTLLSAMENPSAFMQGEEKGLVKTLGETGGLGTVATRADIIEKLFNSFLIEKKGQDIFITSKGKQLLQLVPEDLKSPALTAEWEQKLSAIAAGKLKSAVFIKDMKAYAHQTVKEIKNSSQTFRHDNITGTACPECGKMMLKVNGKRGTMLVCQDRECGSRKTIARKTNARCPNCHKRMELRGQGEGQTFACVCGHREKLSVFEKRKNKDKARATKRDVSSYMKKQNKDEPINNALAEQLKKLGLDK